MCAMQWVDNNDDGHFSPEMWQKGHLRTHWVRVGKVLEKSSGKRPVGQLILKCPFGVIVSTKIPMKFL
jgi:hypothetical protein